MIARYAIYPGQVLSRNDRDPHYISARQLASLYGVKLEDCLVVMPTDYSQPHLRAFIARAATLIALHPRMDGDYTLPLI